MCHQSVHAFAGQSLRLEHAAGKRVLEVGSYDVNGSVRPYIEAMGPTAYLGVDMRPGPLVDAVRDACVPGLCESVGGPFDLVVCTEMLEHAQDWRAAVANLKACVRPGGHLLVTTRSLGFPLHEFPGDHWRYELGDMRRIFADFEILSLMSDPEAPGVLMLARAAAEGATPVDLADVSLHSMESGAPEVVSHGAPRLSVVTWKWGDAFGPEYVNRLRSMFARHLRVPHRFICVTDDPEGVDSRVEVVPPFPDLDLWRHRDSSCLQRLKMYDRAVADALGQRVLLVDLDLILVSDVTPLFGRPDPLALMHWTYTGGLVYGGGIVLMDVGVLHGLWEKYHADPAGYGKASRGSDRLRPPAPAVREVYGRWRQQRRPPPASQQVLGEPSDQSVLNHFLQTHRTKLGTWTEADGIVRYFTGLRARFGPPLEKLLPSVRVVVFGHDDKAVMEEYRHPWIAEHWR